MEERFQVGVITSTHGIKGEVKVFPTTDNPKRFKKEEIDFDTRDDAIVDDRYFSGGSNNGKKSWSR